MLKALLVSIGNELLSGKTVNTNATFLAQKLTKLGFIVNKIVTIPDDQEIIKDEILRELTTGDYCLILITGGLGPTWDDSTAFFLSEALEMECKLNSEALKIVTKRYQELFDQKLVNTPEITPARKKMAFLPLGAEPIDNPVGTAPGIFLEDNTYNTWIICLPGVPREMEEMYRLIEFRISSLADSNQSSYFEVEFTTLFTDESLLAPFLEKVRQKFDVWIKSMPKTYQEEKRIQLIISRTSDSKSKSQDEVIAAKSYLQKLIDEKE
jgi:molybdenum cofactor synthesis domain-containing protein